MFIYKVTNTITGKIYIGQTKRRNKNYLGSGILIKKSIDKYGKENFKREILCECCDQENLNKMERYWIRELNSQDPNIGYNLESGGNSHNNYDWAKKTRKPFSEETKRKMAEMARGRKHTPETLEKMSKAKFGKSWEEICGEKTTVERRKSMSKRMLGNKYCVGRKPWNKGLRGINR